VLLAPQEADQFFRIHRALMCFVNDRLQVIPDIGTPDEFSTLAPETRLEVRNAFLDELDLIELFVDVNPFNLSEEDLEIAASWRHQVAGEFILFRQLKKHMVFLAAEEPPIAYGVLALSDPFEYLAGPYLPIWAETVLLPFCGKIVYDGLLSCFNISFGGGFRRSLNASYQQAKERLGIVTSLPIDACLVAAKQPQKKATVKSASQGESRDAFQVIVGMTDEFCRNHLNEEYAVLCRKLAEKLARKRPSPLVRGLPKTWASGIVRTIGGVNFLDDRSQQPHMKLTAIDKTFGVGESTGQGKSMEIRRMLKIKPFDHEWTLPSRMDDNPLVWMVEVNGFVLDVRDAPKEVQEIAFEKGLIPYIPAKGD
jgi:hypothetical protein